MIDFKWENGMYTIVHTVEDYNEVTESMSRCGFKILPAPDLEKHIQLSEDNPTVCVEILKDQVVYVMDAVWVEPRSQYIDFNDLKKSSQYKPTNFTVDLTPPFWDGEGEPEAGMMVDVEETSELPSTFFRNVELKYSSDYNVVLDTGVKEVHLRRSLVVFHKPTIEPTSLEKLQEWCTNNQRALGVDHLLEEMLKQGLIDLSMLDQITGN